MAEVKGIKPGDTFWYSPYISEWQAAALPREVKCESVAKIDGDLRPVDEYGRSYLPWCVFRTQQEAIKQTIASCKKAIDQSHRQIAECETVLAKLSHEAALDETDVISPIPAQSVEESVIPF